ncbi:MAG: hypothetical protein HFG00_04970 [Oscillibacter sp.]|nr:hypothetical protein [Oscillibacter sp.]
MLSKKRSQDPWDRKPEKPSPPPREPMENPLDSLRAWNAERKSKAKEREEAKRLSPEPCPWCGQDMEQGFLSGGRDSVRWYPGIYKCGPFRGFAGSAADVLNEGSVWSGRYKTVWLCRNCKKAVFDMPEEESFVFLTDRLEAEETKEEEESGE